LNYVFPRLVTGYFCLGCKQLNRRGLNEKRNLVVPVAYRGK